MLQATPQTVASESTSCGSAATLSNVLIAFISFFKECICIATLCMSEQGIEISVICTSGTLCN